MSTRINTRSFLFIDSRVADYQSLIANLDSDTQWVLLDADRDGLLQMQSTLAGYTDLDAIHVISHGSQGTLYLGSTVLNSSNLETYQDQLRAIGNALTETGDLLLYGCNVAQAKEGIQFIQSLASATAADVAASDNSTSNHALYGDTILEISIGNISTLKESGIFNLNVGPVIQLGTLPTTVTPGSGTLITLDANGDYDPPYNCFSINNLLEIDYYRFYAGANGNYTIVIEDGFGEFNMNTRSSIYNSNGDAISSKLDNDYYSDGFYHSLYLQEGWYYISVTATKDIYTPAYFNESNGLYSIAIGGPTQIHTPPSDTDSNDQISEALSLGAMSVDRTGYGFIDVGTDVDMWSFSVTAGQRLAFDIDRPSGTLDSYIRLFNSSGTQLAFNDDGSAPNELVSTTDSWLEYTFTNSGTYYIGVSNWYNSSYSPITGAGDVTGSTGEYNLNISVTGGNIASTIQGTLPGSSYQVEIRRYDEPNKAISPTERTWLVIHGRNGNLDSDGNILALAESISQQRSSDQVLILDWTSAATDSGYTHEDWIPVVGEWARDVLQRHGFQGSNLNLVGHSWGSYVAAQLAEGLGGVNTIIALDPAENSPVPGASWNPDEAGEINFARDSTFSWAFYSRDAVDLIDGGVLTGGIAGSETTAPTADESYVVIDSGHGPVVNLFANILATDDFNQLFNLQRLLNQAYGPWVLNEYDSDASGSNSGYEAVIDASGNGSTPNWIKYISSPSRIEQTVYSQGVGVNPPVVSGKVMSIAAGQAIAASALFSVSDPNGDAITSYRFNDPSGNGYFSWPTGTTAGISWDSTSHVLTVAASALGYVTYKGDAAGIESLGISASDGSMWSSVATSTITITTNGTGGTAGNDTFLSGSANETYDGGNGTDIAIYDGTVGQYSISLNRATHRTTVTDSQAGRDGTDTLINVEKLKFGNLTFDLFNPTLASRPQYAQSDNFLFDAAYYLLCHPDLVTAGVTLQTAFNHYLSTGAALGYKPNSWFDADYYENRWVDLKAVHYDDATLFRHYNLYGVWEGRSAGPDYDQFNGNRYLSDYPDVAAYVDGHVNDFLGSRTNGAIAHYIIDGSVEGRLAYATSGDLIDTSLSIAVSTLPGADTVAPRLMSASPSDEATSVAVSSNIVLNFDEAVRAGSGNIYITNLSSGGIRTIPVTDTSQVSFSGSSMTINPSADLSSNARYSVTFPAGVVKDLSDNNFSVLASSDLNFNTAPELINRQTVNLRDLTYNATNFSISYDAGNGAYEFVVDLTKDIYINVYGYQMFLNAAWQYIRNFGADDSIHIINGTDNFWDGGTTLFSGVENGTVSINSGKGYNINYIELTGLPSHPAIFSLDAFNSLSVGDVFIG